MREWSADVTVDEPIVRRLIGGQFPAVELASLRLLAEGWDNAVWLADERWAFRFPRRTMGVEAIERELRVLRRLAPALPAPGGPSAGRPACGASSSPRVAPPSSPRTGRSARRNRCGRALAVDLCAILAVYGHEEGLRGVEREALEGPDRCLS